MYDAQPTVYFQPLFKRLVTYYCLTVDENGSPMGLINWFPVHCTSMNNTNEMISGDNKGYASYLFEQSVNGNTSTRQPGRGPFVAAFAQANEGDVSPNTKGPHCLDTGLPCDVVHSTCHGKVGLGSL